MQIFNSLFPIFAVIGLGVLLRRRQFFTEDITDGFNRFAYFVGLPLFLFYKLGSAPPVGGLAHQFMAILIAATLGTALVGWVAAILIRLPPQQKSVVVQGSFRGNLAFIGLPLILFAMAGLPETERAQIEAATYVALPPVIILYNVVSVLVFSIYGRQESNQFSILQMIVSVITNPLLLACLAGLVVQIVGWKIPVAIFRTCEVLGASAFPLALLGIGSQLANKPLGTEVRIKWVTSLIKCVGGPLIAWGVAWWLGIGGIKLQVVLILAATPTAVSSFVLADQMDGDSELAAGIVVFCTATSLVTLSVLLWLSTPVVG